MLLTNMLNPNVLFRQMDRAFNDLAGTMSEVGRSPTPVNVWEDDQTVTVEAELPGFKIEQVEVTWEKQTLTIRGTREVTEPEGTRFLHRERSVGEFSRTLTINREINPEGVAASMRDGVLTITLAKAPVAQARKVVVSRG